MKNSELNTRTNSPDVLLHEAASHSYNYRLDLCHCLYLSTESYLVANDVTYLSSQQCLNVTLSISTHQYQVDTAPSRINALVTGFQEPLTANLLSELIRVHETNVLFDANVWFDATYTTTCGLDPHLTTCGLHPTIYDYMWIGPHPVISRHYLLLKRGTMRFRSRGPMFKIWYQMSQGRMDLFFLLVTSKR